MNWQRRRSIDAKRLKKHNDALALELLRVKEELQTADRHRIGLEVLLDLRGEKIDKLSAQVDQLRRQNQKLDAECEHLVEMVRAAPPANVVLLAPK